MGWMRSVITPRISGLSAELALAAAVLITPAHSIVLSAVSGSFPAYKRNVTVNEEQDESQTG